MPTPLQSKDPDPRELARAAVEAIGGQVLADTYADGVDYRLDRWPLSCIGDVRVTNGRRGEAQVTARLTPGSQWLLMAGALVSISGFVAMAWLTRAPLAIGLVLLGSVLAAASTARAIRVGPRRVHRLLADAVTQAARKSGYG
jgi:hypothetical protein